MEIMLNGFENVHALRAGILVGQDECDFSLDLFYMYVIYFIYLLFVWVGAGRLYVVSLLFDLPVSELSIWPQCFQS